MGVRSWIVNKLAGDIIENKVNGALNVFRYEVPGKEQSLPRLLKFRQQEYKIWASGNPIDLLKFYSTYSIAPGEFDAGSRQLFWEWVKGINTVPKLHYPAPEIIMNQMKSLLFAEDLDIYVSVPNAKADGEDEKLSKEMTSTLMKILLDNDHNEKYQTGTMYETYSGSLAFRPVFNQEISDYPIIIPYPAERFKLRSVLGKVQEIIFLDEYIVDTKKYELRSHYGKGYIQYRLYEKGAEESSDKQVTLDKVPELASGYDDIVITLDGEKPIPLLLAAYKKNRSVSNEFIGTEYGGSDFEGITDHFHLIDEQFSQKNLVIRRSRPMTTMSVRFLEKDKDGKEIIPREFKQDTVIIRGDEGTNSINKPERDVPELKVMAYDESIKNDMKTIWSKIGLAYTTVGLEAHSANISGAALEMKEKSTVIVRSNKIKLWQKFLKNTYQLLMIFNSLKDSNITNGEDNTIYHIKDMFDFNYIIEFPMFNNQTFDELLDEAIKANGVAFDQERTVKYALRNKGYTDDEIDEIVKNIKIENGIPLIGDQLQPEANTE